MALQTPQILSPRRFQTSLPQNGLICFWNFRQKAGTPIISEGQCRYELFERGGTLERVPEGIFDSQSLRFQNGVWLESPRHLCPKLNFSGARSHFTLVAWFKREQSPPVLNAAEWDGCEAVAGMWNEHGNRQYCMFLSLKFAGGSDQIGAHVSRHGGPTPPYPYCTDAAIGSSKIPFMEWVCGAIAYDGFQASVWVNGELDFHPGLNPFDHPGVLHDSGPNGSDFTVGAVRRAGKMLATGPEGDKIGNPFSGLLAGLAVYERVLSPQELRGFCF